jgi:hypothetical protein
MELKILHIIPSLRKGGAERIVLDICNELNKVYMNEQMKESVAFFLNPIK